MKIARTHLLARLALVASVSVGLAACGGSSDNNEDDQPAPETHNVPVGHGLTEGRDATIEAGGTLKTPTGTLACPEDGMDCMIKVIPEIDGSFTATSTGGEVTFTADEPAKTVAEMQMEAFDAAKMAIEAAATEAAAQAAYDTVDKDDITAKQADDLQTALNTRIGEIQAAALKPFNDAKAAIEGAATEAAAQAAYDAVDQSAITGEQAADLMAALAKRKGELEEATRIASQKKTLMDLADAIDTSDLKDADGNYDQEKVNAARSAISALRDALDNQSDDVSDADKAPYEMKFTEADAEVTEAQGGINLATRRSTQMSELADAHEDLQDALDAFAGSTATKDQLDTAKGARTALKGKLDAALDLSTSEKDKYQTAHDSAEGTIAAAEKAFNTAENKRIADETKAKQDMAKELHFAIRAQSDAGVGDDDSNGVPVPDVGADLSSTNANQGVLNAGYDPDNSDIRIVIGDAGSEADGEIFTLKEDKKTTVASIGDWTGQRFYVQQDGGNKLLHEAFVYSYVGKATPGKKFSTVYTLGSEDDDYQLIADEADAKNTPGQPTDVFAPKKVSIPSVTRTAGEHEFEKVRTRDDEIEVAGSYHGVTGTYRCELGSADNASCTAKVTADGLMLGGADTPTWVFVPSSRDARVSDSSDVDYASFGWWVEKEGSDINTVSVFEDFRGVVGTGLTESSFDGLEGTATYKGGAIGQYAFRSDTGGKNESGHFVATATLEADFDGGGSGESGDISGTIDDFKVGDDGAARDWSVALEESEFTPTAGVATAGASDDGTVWTMGSGDDAAAADASGSWQVNIRNNTNGGDGGIPEVATGVFFSEFGTEGKMVGSFGAVAE